MHSRCPFIEMNKCPHATHSPNEGVTYCGLKNGPKEENTVEWMLRRNMKCPLIAKKKKKGRR